MTNIEKLARLINAIDINGTMVIGGKVVDPTITVHVLGKNGPLSPFEFTGSGIENAAHDAFVALSKVASDHAYGLRSHAHMIELSCYAEPTIETDAITDNFS